MRLATLVAFTLDRRKGITVREPTAFSVLLAEFKERVVADDAPDDKYPRLELWTSSGCEKTHKFRKAALKASKKIEKDKQAEIERLDAEATEKAAVAAKDEADALAKEEEALAAVVKENVAAAEAKIEAEKKKISDNKADPESKKGQDTETDPAAPPEPAERAADTFRAPPKKAKKGE